MDLNTICCLQCCSTNIESHNQNEEKKLVAYWCADCGLRFTNFDFTLQCNLRHKLLALKYNEFSQAQLIEATMKNVANRKLEKHMSVSDANKYVYSSENFIQMLFNACFIESMVLHLESFTEENG